MAGFDLKNKILESSLVGSIQEKLKRTSLPGFDGISNFDVGNFFLAEIRRDSILVRSRAVAFSFMQATFPALIFIVTLIPYIPVANMEQSFLRLMSDLLPTNAYQFIADTIKDIFNTQRFGLLSFGFLFAFYFATNGVNSMVRAFDKQQPTFSKRNFWQDKLVSVQLTTYIVILFIGSLTLIIWGQDIVRAAGSRYGVDRSIMINVFTALKWGIVVFLYFGTISLIYHYGPAKKKKWKFVTPGSTLATLLSIIATVGFAFFVNRFGRFNQLYGSIGALIVFMIWMNINTLVLLVGFELNNSIDMNKQLRQPKTD